MNFDLLLMLAFLVAVFAAFVWFASQLLKGFKRDRGAFQQALEKSRELLATGKITPKSLRPSNVDSRIRD